MARPWEIALSRRTGQRPSRRYLIVAEDAKSGLNYLLSFQIPPRFAEIVTEGGAGNTVSVVERALHLREEAVRSKAPFIHTWCVFDRDEHPKERYQRAFDLAKPYDDVTVIWANECFETLVFAPFLLSRYRHRPRRPSQGTQQTGPSESQV